jgi:hypothetical protein
MPYARCIVVLREPGARLFSAFHYYKRMFGGGGPPPSAQDFHTHVTDSIAAWTACVAKHGGERGALACACGACAKRTFVLSRSEPKAVNLTL